MNVNDSRLKSVKELDIAYMFSFCKYRIYLIVEIIRKDRNNQGYCSFAVSPRFPLKQRLANVIYKGPDSKCLRLYWPHTVSVAYLFF